MCCARIVDIWHGWNRSNPYERRIPCLCTFAHTRPRAHSAQTLMRSHGASILASAVPQQKGKGASCVACLVIALDGAVLEGPGSGTCGLRKQYFARCKEACTRLCCAEGSGIFQRTAAVPTPSSALLYTTSSCSSFASRRCRRCSTERQCFACQAARPRNKGSKMKQIQTHLITYLRASGRRRNGSRACRRRKAVERLMHPSRAWLKPGPRHVPGPPAIAVLTMKNTETRGCCNFTKQFSQCIHNPIIQPERAMQQ